MAFWLELGTACKRGGVGWLLVTSDAFRNRGSPQLASAVTAEITPYQFATDNRRKSRRV
jgi:hypothetical protein